MQRSHAGAGRLAQGVSLLAGGGSPGLPRPANPVDRAFETNDTYEVSIIVTAVADCLPELPSCLHRS
ncbi:hypothetical protein F01_460392 [Burkholderia cenocepacia]|nr:hypothetical protein F01_460392 [Burkholderia cenocepacia]